jgi:two-component system, chemotaxis family, protein-glutamate methylesterase/glutaminase
MFDGVLRVAVIDDSALYRQMILNVLGRIAGVEVVGTAADGDAAVELVARARPDVITLDVQMPGRDGIEVLRALRQRGLAPRSIMVSSLTAQGAPATVAALMEGAFDAILKPAGVDPHVSRELIHRELSEKLNAVRESMAVSPAGATLLPPPQKMPPRPALGTRFDCVVIGTSTGGPQALRAVIPLLPVGAARGRAGCAAHPGAVHLEPRRATRQRFEAAGRRGDRGNDSREAAGCSSPPGACISASGGATSMIFCVLDDGPRRHGCRPSLDHLLESAAATYGSRVLAIVLTGMGCDGVGGLSCRSRAGGARHRSGRGGLRRLRDAQGRHHGRPRRRDRAAGAGRRHSHRPLRLAIPSGRIRSTIPSADSQVVHQHPPEALPCHCSR